MSARWTVYVLIDPRNGEIRYVGCTEDLRMRYNCHLANGRSGWPLTPKVVWLKELFANNLQPIIEPLVETGDPWEVPSLEEAWIRRLSLAGCRLTVSGNRERLIAQGVIRPDQRRTSSGIWQVKAKGYQRIAVAA